MPRLTLEEIRLILDALRDNYGPGYAEDPAVGKLQAKLSMMEQALASVAALQNKVDKEK